MSTTGASATEVVGALELLRSDRELAKIHERLAPGEPAIGVRMGELFDVAKAHTDLPIEEVHRLLDHPAYEPRMAAMCILDFKARRRLADHQRHELYRTYLDRHDRITTWDMVDRAAPRVVGARLVGRSCGPLHELATAGDLLRRRTATTATLWFTRSGSSDDLDEGFAIAGRLAGDPEPVVHNAVGIFLRHAGTRDPDALHRFLTEHAASMPRSALRSATEKLDPTERARYLG